MNDFFNDFDKHNINTAFDVMRVAEAKEKEQKQKELERQKQEQEKEVDILILGNGFDLAHGLKTRYTDFLDYWKKDKNVENVWLKHFVNRQKQLGNKWIDLEREIYNVVGFISLGFSSNPNDTISKTYSFQKGCTDETFDLNKIKKELTFFRDLETDEKEYGKLGNDIPKYYFKTYKGLINFLYDQLRDFTNKFNGYLSTDVLPNIGNKKFNFNLSQDKTIRVLNFNYTNTYKKLYDTLGIYSNTKYIYVHGKVCDSNDCNLVLGTQSFSNEEIDVEFNIFKKHNQRQMFGTIEAYQDLLNELNDRRKIITPTFHIIGHSLDKTDHNILRHIFKARESSKINIYYHNEDALRRLINNITEIIGEDEVTTKVQFIHQEDPERGILIPK